MLIAEVSNVFHTFNSDFFQTAVLSYSIDMFPENLSDDRDVFRFDIEENDIHIFHALGRVSHRSFNHLQMIKRGKDKESAEVKKEHALS